MNIFVCHFIKTNDKMIPFFIRFFSRRLLLLLCFSKTKNKYIYLFGESCSQHEKLKLKSKKTKKRTSDFFRAHVLTETKIIGDGTWMPVEKWLKLCEWVWKNESDAVVALAHSIHTDILRLCARFGFREVHASIVCILLCGVRYEKPKPKPVGKAEM